MSRSMKPLPNKHLQAWVAANAALLNGLDGEFIIGSAGAPEVFNRSTSVIMSDEKPIDGIGYYVFDVIDRPTDRFSLRYQAIRDRLRSAPADLPIHIVEQILIQNEEELLQFEQASLAAGYEGVMLRDQHGLYKQGRSSTREGGLLKVKRFEDAEAEIIRIEEEMHNTNEAERNELGRTKRSSAAAGLVGKGTMGALVCRGLNGPFDGVTFNIGTGFTAAQRAADWPIGSVVTYKYLAIGVKDKPRHPVFKGIRHPADLDFITGAKVEKVQGERREMEEMDGFGTFS
jgi:DNA ligase-1